MRLYAGKFAGENMSTLARTVDPFFPVEETGDTGVAAGFRRGAIGTHSSRTIMFDDLSAVLSATLSDAEREDYATAIIETNCLGKPTASTRRLANQRLGELYALDPAVPIFRVLRRLWDSGASGRRLLAVSCAVARDPLLAVTASPILAIPQDGEFLRGPVRSAVRALVGDRLNESVLDKVVRNVASSWTQSGHLEGRTFKKRRLVQATPATGAFAAYLAYAAGIRGAEIFTSGWFAMLDASPLAARDIALEAKRLGLIDLRIAGDVVELNVDRLVARVVR